MKRLILAAIAIALLVVFGVGAASAQTVKLRDSKIKGELYSESCRPSTATAYDICTLVDLSSYAPDEFFYVTQVCSMNVYGAAIATGIKYSGLNRPYVAAWDMPGRGTKCHSFDPALLVEPNSSLQCVHISGSYQGFCLVTGVLSKK